MIRRQTIGYCVLGTLKIGRYNNSQIYLLLHMTCKNVKRRNGLIKKYKNAMIQYHLAHQRPIAFIKYKLVGSVSEF